MNASVKYVAAVAGTIILASVGLFAAKAVSVKTVSTAEHAQTTACAVRENSLLPNKRQEVWIDGGAFVMGTNVGYPEEGPESQQSVDGFWMDVHEVTNAQFAAFVDATGYVTVAERGLDGMIGSAVFIPPSANAPMSAMNWWKFVEGASWRAPTGPGSSIEDKDDLPVVHIALEDAEAYAAWAGRRLPTEAEWEFAARSGLERATYEWGEEKPDDGAPKANTWQGMFPVINTKSDGFEGLAPAGCYKANAFGLFDMTGNVWEWTSTAYYTQHGIEDGGEGRDPRQPGVPVNVVKGGSFLCAENYCVRYRPAARHPQDHNLGTSHIGFRTVRDAVTQG